MKIPRSFSLPVSADTINQSFQLLAKNLAKGVSFGATTNNTDLDIGMDCWKATGTTPGVANTTFTVNHNLQRIPIGFITARVSGPSVIYDSGAAWTAATNSALGTISLQCNGTNIAFTIIII